MMNFFLKRSVKAISKRHNRLFLAFIPVIIYLAKSGHLVCFLLYFFSSFKEPKKK